MSLKHTAATIIILTASTTIACAGSAIKQKIRLYGTVKEANPGLKQVGMHAMLVEPSDEVAPGVFSTIPRKKRVEEAQYPWARVTRICEETFRKSPLVDLKTDIEELGPIRDIKVPYGSFRQRKDWYLGWIESQDQTIFSADNIVIERYHDREGAVKSIKKEIKKPNACNLVIKDHIKNKNSVFIATGVIRAEGYTEYWRPKHKIFAIEQETLRGLTKGELKEAGSAAGIPGTGWLGPLDSVFAQLSEAKFKSNATKPRDVTLGLEPAYIDVRQRRATQRRLELDESDLGELEALFR